MNFLQRLALQKKKTCWQLASRCCWNRARPWHPYELVSFLVGLRTFQHPGRYCPQQTWTTLSLTPDIAFLISKLTLELKTHKSCPNSCNFHCICCHLFSQLIANLNSKVYRQINSWKKYKIKHLYQLSHTSHNCISAHYILYRITFVIDHSHAHVYTYNGTNCPYVNSAKGIMY